MKLEGMDPESSATASFYFGILGAALSLIGVLLSVYSFADAEKSLWLGISGWLAAGISAWALTKLCLNLININTRLNQRLQDATNQSTLLAEQNDELRTTNSKLIDIDAYIVSKAVRKPVARKESKSAEAHPTVAQPAPQAEEDLEDEA